MLSSQLKGEIEIPGDVETKFLIMIFVLKTNFACWTAHKKNQKQSNGPNQFSQQPKLLTIQQK